MLRKAMFLTMTVFALTSQSAWATSDLGFKAIGGAVSVVGPEEMDTTFGLGIMLDHGTIVPQLALESRLDYWSQSEESFGSEVKARDITVGARCKYLFKVSNPTFQPFAGAGLGLHFVHAEVNVVPPPGFPGFGMNAEDSATKLGLDLGGGMAAAVGPRTSVLAELWYGVVSDFSQLSLRVGMAYRFGPQGLASKSTPPSKGSATKGAATKSSAAKAQPKRQP